MKRILLGALCAVTTLALLTGCVKTTAAPGGSSSADAPGSAPGSASGPITTLPDPDAKPIPAQLTADWTEDAVSDTWDTAPEAPAATALCVLTRWSALIWSHSTQGYTFFELSPTPLTFRPAGIIIS